MNSSRTAVLAGFAWSAISGWGCFPAYCQTAPGDFNKIGIYHQNGVDPSGNPLISYWYADSNGHFAWDAPPDATYAFGVDGAVAITGDWTGAHQRPVVACRG